jgi:hypothetical protein
LKEVIIGMSGPVDLSHKTAKTGHGSWNGRVDLEFIPRQPHEVIASEAVTYTACEPPL